MPSYLSVLTFALLAILVGGWPGWQWLPQIRLTKQTKKKNMNNKFDELTKSLAQSVTRRAALKKFGVGLAGMALACFGLANRAKAAGWVGAPCATDKDCHSGRCFGGCAYASRTKTAEEVPTAMAADAFSGFKAKRHWNPLGIHRVKSHG